MLPITSPKFTWFNNRQGGAFTKEKLDRALSNPIGLEVYTDFFCKVFPTLKSDHSPLLISIFGIQSHKRKKCYMFRYEEKWDLNEECADIIQMPGREEPSFNKAPEL